MKNLKKTMKLLNVLLINSFPYKYSETNKLFDSLEYDKNNNLTLNSIIKFHCDFNELYTDLDKTNYILINCMMLYDENFIKFKNIIMNCPKNELLKEDIEKCFEKIKFNEEGDITYQSFRNIMQELAEFKTVYIGDAFTQLGLL